jgi:6-phosphogluconolactonase (cycloisomerase 2 family)
MIGRSLSGSLQAKLSLVCAVALLSACHGGGGGDAPPPPPATYTIGGTVTGLAGAGLVLRNNGGNDLAPGTSSAFAFTTALAGGAAYAVTVQAQPANPTQTCTVANGSGTVAAANIGNVTVTCVTNTYNVGGTISGLSGSGLVLQINGAGDFPINPNTSSFTFGAKIPSGGAYAVTVRVHPAGQTCTIANASGTVAAADVGNVALSCFAGALVGGNVHGLLGAGLVLSNNGSDPLAVNADGAFTFRAPVAVGAQYNVLASTHPLNPAQECTATRNSGTVGSGPVTDVSIDCYVMGKFLYATQDIFDRKITGASIDQSTGALTAVPNAPFPAGSIAFGSVATPDGKFVYMWSSDNTLYGYAVDPITGTLTAVPTANGGFSVRGAGMHPSGKFLYLGDLMSAPARFLAFAINPTTGRPTLIGSPITTPDPTVSPRVDPTGRFLYLLTEHSAAPSAVKLFTYSIDPTTGAPMLVGSPLTVANATAREIITIAANGAALFVDMTSQLYAYTLDAITGAPTPMAGSPFAVAQTDVVSHPKLPVLYVGHAGGVRAYGVGSSLTPLSGSPYAVNNGDLGTTIVLDPGARFLYAAGRAGSAVGEITPFAIKADGSLEPLPGAALPLSFGPNIVVADPGGRYLYAIRPLTADIVPIPVNTTTGRLSAPGNPFVVGGSGPNSLTVVK